MWPNSKAEDVDAAECFLTVKVAECDDQVIVKHDNLLCPPLEKEEIDHVLSVN